VGELDELTPAETADLWATVTLTVRATKAAYGPDGLNVGLNVGKAAGGSVNQHLHVHVVPRWAGDVSFMTSVANVRTIPEALGDTLAKLRSGFATALGR
jgi:ATP adenylyltransferase